MKIELWQLFFTVVAYLGALFLVAYAAERGWIARRLLEHPLVYVLSLGVYATSWTYYGSVGLAAKSGYTFLTIYLGVTLTFIMAPILLNPILRLVREYQLTSLADLFAFRFRSPVTGFLVTMFMLIGILPYISLQIQAVVESIKVLTGDMRTGILAPAYCVTLTIFAILFGARHITPREKHEGLVAAIAFESAVKLVALLAVGAFAVFGIFGGLGEMQHWLQANPEALDKLYRPVATGPWLTLLLLAFCAAFLLPRQFHMIFVENLNSGALRHAAWMFPLFLLLLNLPIVPVLWAGRSLQLEMSPDFYVLGITLNEENGLWLLTFIGGVSASSAMMIVTSLALASMALNHIILPMRFIGGSVGNDLYRWILWGKRALIAVIVAGGYGFFHVIDNNEGLVHLGLISFVAAAQLLPGVLALLFWRRANSNGFIAGLLGGALVWFGVLIMPLLVNSDILTRDVDLTALFRQGDSSIWTVATFWSLAANTFLLVMVSLVTRSSDEEREAAEACSERGLTPLRGQVTDGSPKQFEKQLSRIIGPAAAEHEVGRALEELQLERGEQRPAELRLLRDRIERNLSGMLGPVLARMIVDNRLQLRERTHTALADSIRFMEERLKDSHSRMRGVVVELDNLRRYHREVLYELPLGVCALGPNDEIIIWNLAMQVISGIDERSAVGKSVSSLPEPWRGFLVDFLQSPDTHRYKQTLETDELQRSINLHKAEIGMPEIGQQAETGGQVIIVEDRSELETLETSLAHSERLASIGRIAAGVAHEIGNPLTGITSIAQNLRHETDSDGVRQNADDVLKQTDRINDIVRTLLTFSHAERIGSEPRNETILRHSIDEAVQLVSLSDAAKQIEWRVECDVELAVEGDHQRLVQVFVNLLNNACDASQPGDPISVVCSRDMLHVTIRVIDKGCGIPETLHERIFEPFFTTKSVGSGTGLGLPLVHGIVHDHNGDITVKSSSRGTEFVIRLPAPSPQSARSSAFNSPAGDPKSARHTTSARDGV
ncbi:MAG: ATP-binding protein [Gammaproteobacteria bacterium]|nr:ATP-binding protein [Gammaproteobacteria bacterium]